MEEGIETIEAALNGMQAIREEMIAAGLRNVFPQTSWPGIRPGDFQRQRESFKFFLEQAGLSEALR